MQLFTRKKSGAGQVAYEAWHPDFRNRKELPDIKTVRTRFFVNLAGVALALGATAYYAVNEYQYHVLERQLQQAQQRVERDTKPSRDAVAMYKKFSVEETKTKEFVAFVNAEPVVFTDFVSSIGQNLPQNITIVSIQYNRTEIRLQGQIKGAPEQAAGLASAYEKILRDSPDYSGKFDSISISSVARDPSGAGVTFDISMKLKK